jgi:hypothetical protein
MSMPGPLLKSFIDSRYDSPLKREAVLEFLNRVKLKFQKINSFTLFRRTSC